MNTLISLGRVSRETKLELGFVCQDPAGGVFVNEVCYVQDGDVCIASYRVYRSPAHDNAIFGSRSEECTAIVPVNEVPADCPPLTC